jgi:hypothetical protein
MTLDEVFDLEDRYIANAGRSVVSKEGIARWKREQTERPGTESSQENATQPPKSQRARSVTLQSAPSIAATAGSQHRPG